jgi:hypothetical protein
MGGSVTEYTISRSTRRGPEGDQERAKTCTQSKTKRTHRSAMNVQRIASMT